MSESHVRISCRNLTSELHVRTSCRNLMSEFHVRISRQNFTSELHVRKLHVRISCQKYSLKELSLDCKGMIHGATSLSQIQHGSQSAGNIVLGTLYCSRKIISLSQAGCDRA